MKRLFSLPSLPDAIATAAFAAALLAQIVLMPLYFYSSDAKFQMNRTRNSAQVSYSEHHHTGLWIMGCYFPPTSKARR